MPHPSREYRRGSRRCANAYGRVAAVGIFLRLPGGFHVGFPHPMQIFRKLELLNEPVAAARDGNSPNFEGWVEKQRFFFVRCGGKTTSCFGASGTCTTLR